MPTANRRAFVPLAIRCFLAQDYALRELVIVDDGEDRVEDLVPDDVRIRYTRLDSRRSVGAKRNLGCHLARGEIMVHWDDDDWHAPDQISRQVAFLAESGVEVCGLARVLYHDPVKEQSWEYVYSGPRHWVAGATLCYLRERWVRAPFPDRDVEDVPFVYALPEKSLAAMPDNRFFVAMLHRSHASPKRVSPPLWHPVPAEIVAGLLGDEILQYRARFAPYAARAAP